MKLRQHSVPPRPHLQLYLTLHLSGLVTGSLGGVSGAGLPGVPGGLNDLKGVFTVKKCLRKIGRAARLILVFLTMPMVRAIPYRPSWLMSSLLMALL